MAPDFERVDRFYREFQVRHDLFFQSIQGIDRDRDRHWYTSVLFNRLIPIYFLQRRGWLDEGDRDYLENKLGQSQLRGENRFFNEFLQALFFEGLAKPEIERNPTVPALLGKVPNWNGNLFRSHSLEGKYPDIAICDRAFEELFEWFGTYEWRLEDGVSDGNLEMTPELWGYTFEQYVNRDEFAAYFTPPEIAEYLCDRTVGRAIVDGVNRRCDRAFNNFEELMVQLDPSVCGELVRQVLPSLSILDPACGSGTLLLAAMKMLLSTYVAAIEIIENQGDSAQRTWLSQWMRELQADRFSLWDALQRRIATDNLYGVDIREEAIEIAQLRLYLEFIAASDRVEELERLPNLDFNLMVGNSLIGWIRVDEEGFDAVGEYQQGNLLQPLVADSYRQILREKQIRIEQYKAQSFILQEAQDVPDRTNPQLFRDRIADVDRKAQQKLDRLLLDEFSLRLGIQYPQSHARDKPKKRLLELADIEALKPFHWGYQFNKIMEERGGFDAIVTHPPWESFKPDIQNFIAQYQTLLKQEGILDRNGKLDRGKFSQSPKIFSLWQDYKNWYTFVSAYYRSTDRYQYQTLALNERKIKNHLYLYNLFLELCFQVLRSGGYCALVIPTRFYRNLESTELRKMLFDRTKIGSIVRFDRDLNSLPAIPEEMSLSLFDFKNDGKTSQIKIFSERQSLTNHPEMSPIEIERSNATAALSNPFYIWDFRSKLEFQVLQKINRFSPLEEFREDCWNFKWGKDSTKSQASSVKFFPDREQLLRRYDGNAIEQFSYDADLIKSTVSNGNIDPVNDREYRLVIKANTRKSDPRTTIATLLPPDTRCGNSLFVAKRNRKTFLSPAEKLATLAILNSFVVDFSLRTILSDRVNLFYLSQLRLPRIQANDRYFGEIVERSARLICTRSEFDDLAREVGLGSHACGVTDEEDRTQLRAELDAIVAHLYGLTESEFQYLLSTFPKVPESVKVSAIEAYRFSASSEQ